jgi:CRISPR-associated protein Csm2
MNEKEIISLLEEIEKLEKRKKKEEEERLKQVTKKLDEQLDIILGQILGGNSEILVRVGDSLGEYFKRKGLSTSQIRNIYAQVRTMRSYDRDALNLLRPRLAYAAGRHNEVSGLQKILDAAIIRVNDEKKFENFRCFFEAILAYHKYHGGD